MLKEAHVRHKIFSKSHLLQLDTVMVQCYPDDHFFKQNNEYVKKFSTVHVDLISQLAVSVIRVKLSPGASEYDAL